jgi:hypothetical protein
MYKTGTIVDTREGPPPKLIARVVYADEELQREIFELIRNKTC